MIPAMLPPPTPFKAVVLSAAAFEMSFVRFLVAIFAGRFFRFLILGFLTLRFGPAVVDLGVHLVAHRFRWVLLAVLLGLVGWLIWRRKANQQAATRASATILDSDKPH